MTATQPKPNAAAVPDVVSLLEQMHMALGAWNVATDMTNALFSVPIKKEDRK